MTKLTGSVTLILAIVGAVVGAQQYVQAEVAEVKKEAKADAAVIQTAHRLDVYEGKHELALQKLELLRAVDAPQHRIDDAQAEVEFWRVQVHAAREALTQQ